MNIFFYLVAGKGPVFGQVQLEVGAVLGHKVADGTGLRPNVVDCAHMVPEDRAMLSFSKVWWRAKSNAKF